MSEHLFDLFRLELLADLAPEYLQIAGSPMISNTLHHIPITGSYILDLFHQDNVMCPIQMLDGESKIIPI